MSDPRPETSCLPCVRGAHSCCRHYPDGPRFGRGDKSKPCACEASGHELGKDTCSASVDASGGWGSRRCGKPVKGTVPGTYTWGREATETDVPVCGVHAAAHRRRVANDVKREEESRARQAQWRHDEETARAIDEALERLRPKLAALGIHPDTAHRTKHGIALPAEALERLVRDALQLDEIMGGS